MPKLTQKIIVHFFNYDLPVKLLHDIMLSLNGGTEQIEAVNAIKGINGYAPVAIITYDEDKSIEENLEYAYLTMQNSAVTDSWTLTPPAGLTVLVDPINSDGRIMGHRSACTGDLLEIGGNQYVVAMFGFTKLN